MDSLWIISLLELITVRNQLHATTGATGTGENGYRISDMGYEEGKRNALASGKKDGERELPFGTF